MYLMSAQDQIQAATPTFFLFYFPASSPSREVHCCYLDYEQVQCIASTGESH